MRLAPWFLVGASALASVIAAPVPSATARLFFVVLLGGALIAALSVVGRHAQTAAALTLLALVLGQIALQNPISPPPSSQWTVALSAPAERIRHTIAPPTGSAAWSRWWSRATQAAVYVCARGPLTESDGLDLFIGGGLLTRITQAHASGPRPQPTSVGFYRIPLDRSMIETTTPIDMELRRAPGSSPRPIEVCGTFTHRPTAGIESSAFFDGGTWKSPGVSQRGRYVIEVRLEDADGRVVAALY